MTAAPVPAIVGEILEIDVAEISVGERLRPVDLDWAQALAGIIRAEGQRTPIEVCRLPGRRGFTLVSGAHRLEAIKSLCWLHVRAIVVDADKADRRAREVSENLWRKGLDPVDRAAFVAELYELLRAKSGVAAATEGRVVSANARWEKAAKADATDASVTMTLAYGWADGVAEKVGISRETVYRDLALFRRLQPSVAAILRGHPIFNNSGQMRALAKLEGLQQRVVAEMIAAGTARSVADALAVSGQKTTYSPEQKRFNSIIGTLARMGAGERQVMLDEIAGRYTQASRRALAKAGAFDEGSDG